MPEREAAESDGNYRECQQVVGVSAGELTKGMLDGYMGNRLYGTVQRIH